MQEHTNINNPYSEVISTHSSRQADRQSRCSKPAESCNYFVLNCSPVTRVDWIRSNVLLPCACLRIVKYILEGFKSTLGVLQSRLYFVKLKNIERTSNMKSILLSDNTSIKDRFCILFFVIVIVIMHISNVYLLVLSKATG